MGGKAGPSPASKNWTKTTFICILKNKTGAGEMGWGQSLFAIPPKLTDMLWTREMPAHALKGSLMNRDMNGSLPTEFT